MSELNDLFRRRIGLPEDAKLTFEELGTVLERMATTIPFENLRVMGKRSEAISQEHLTDKILVGGEGGLCYEINTLLYLFLADNGFEAATARAVVYYNETESYSTVGRTHVTVLLRHEGRTYLLDSGFGGNLALKPVPLTGETVVSRNGEFRVEPADGRFGDYTYKMKIKHKDEDWKIGYTFDSKKLASGIAEHEEVRDLVFDHPDSSFNKLRLVTRLTEDGNVTLTDTSFTEWRAGVVTKEEIGGGDRFEELLNRHFGLSTFVHSAPANGIPARKTKPSS